MKEAELTASISGRNSKKEDTPEKALTQLPLDEKTVEDMSDLDSQDRELFLLSRACCEQKCFEVCAP